MKIFEAIRRDRERQRLTLKILVETHGDTAPRKEYFEDLKHQLKQHAIAVERALYVPSLDSDTTIDASRRGIAKHHQIDKLIALLDKTDLSSPAWLKTVKELQTLIELHFAEQEDEFFPQVEEVMSLLKKDELALRYEAEMLISRS